MKTSDFQFSATERQEILHLTTRLSQSLVSANLLCSRLYNESKNTEALALSCREWSERLSIQMDVCVALSRSLEQRLIDFHRRKMLSVVGRTSKTLPQEKKKAKTPTD